MLTNRNQNKKFKYHSVIEFLTLNQTGLQWSNVGHFFLPKFNQYKDQVPLRVEGY